MKDRHMKIGELLVKDGLLTAEQLDEALRLQREHSERLPLGEVCVHLKFISRGDFRNFLRRQQKHIYLGELLVNLGLLKEEQVEEALHVQKTEKKKLGKLLLEKGYLTEPQLIETLSIQLGIPKIIPDINLIDKKLLKGINAAFLLRHESLPAFKEGTLLTVIMSDPLNAEITRDLESFFKCRINPAIASSDEIKRAIKLYYKSPEFGPLEPLKQVETEEEIKDLVIGDTDLSQSSPDDNIVEILNYIISRAVIEGASDIHIEPLERALRVRYRIDGILYHKTDLPLSVISGLVTRIKVLCGLDISEKRRHQDGRIQARVMGKEVDFRVSTYASMWGENVVIRILQRKSAIVDLDMLGFSPLNMKRYRSILDHPSGIILVTGPTGCGKTTTLYASLQYLNSIAKKIITVEDPVEYTIDGVVQGKLDPKLGLTYMDFLKSMMRQDPDVLMIGEIRDASAAEASIQAALTGHQVFSTFHTDDTTGALLRLMDMGIDTFLISSTVVSVISQRLVRVLCPKCKEPHTPDRAVLSSFRIDSLEPGKYNFYRPKGCQHCNNTGYKGRTAIHEFLLVNDDIRDAILARKSSGQIRHIARKTSGLVSMREDGFYKAAKGITTLEEVVRVVFYNESDDNTARSAEEIYAICEKDDEASMKTPAPKETPAVAEAPKPVAVKKAPEKEPEASAPPAIAAPPHATEGEQYRVRFDIPTIEGETDRIEQLFREYRAISEKAGKQVSAAYLDDFMKFIIDSAWNLRAKKNADYVEFSLTIKDGRACIMMETIVPEAAGYAAEANGGLG